MHRRCSLMPQQVFAASPPSVEGLAKAAVRVEGRGVQDGGGGGGAAV